MTKHNCHTIWILARDLPTQSSDNTCQPTKYYIIYILYIFSHIPPLDHITTSTVASMNQCDVILITSHLLGAKWWQLLQQLPNKNCQWVQWICFGASPVSHNDVRNQPRLSLAANLALSGDFSFFFLRAQRKVSTEENSASHKNNASENRKPHCHMLQGSLWRFGLPQMQSVWPL